MTEDLMNVREAAAYLALRPWSLYRLIETGQLGVHRIGPRGRTIRIARRDLEAYLAARHSPVNESTCR